jgi:hypothetical protein
MIHEDMKLISHYIYDMLYSQFNEDQRHYFDTMYVSLLLYKRKTLTGYNFTTRAKKAAELKSI